MGRIEEAKSSTHLSNPSVFIWPNEQQKATASDIFVLMHCSPIRNFNAPRARKGIPSFVARFGGGGGKMFSLPPANKQF
jgi:hypothetical protein